MLPVRDASARLRRISVPWSTYKKRLPPISATSRLKRAGLNARNSVTQNHQGFCKNPHQPMARGNSSLGNSFIGYGMI